AAFTPRVQSEPAKPDIGRQDRLGADGGQLIHDFVHTPTRDQRPDGNPVRVGQGRDGGRLQARRDRGGLVQDRAGTVVIEHQILLTEHHTLDPRYQLIARRLRPGPAALVALVQHGFLIAQRITEGSQVVQAQGAPGPDHVGFFFYYYGFHRDLH